MHYIYFIVQHYIACKIARTCILQGRVLEVGGGSGTGVGAGVGVGAIRCGDGVTELRPASPRPHAHYNVRILTPAGAPLDNPDDVRREYLMMWRLGFLSIPPS